MYIYIYIWVKLWVGENGRTELFTPIINSLYSVRKLIDHDEEWVGFPAAKIVVRKLRPSFDRVENGYM